VTGGEERKPCAKKKKKKRDFSVIQILIPPRPRIEEEEEGDEGDEDIWPDEKWSREVPQRPSERLRVDLPPANSDKTDSRRRRRS